MLAWTLDSDGQLLDRKAYAGVVSHLALIRDGVGGNRFLWVDAAFGLDESSFMRHQGRLIQAPVVVETGVLAATVFSTDDGFELQELAEASEMDVMDVDCAQGAVSFSLDWMANGRCSLEDMNGQRVLLEVW